MAAVVLGFFGDKFLGIACTLEAETSVSNLTQYKLFIGDDKKKMLSGVTFSFNFLESSTQVYSQLRLRYTRPFRVQSEKTCCPQNRTENLIMNVRVLYSQPRLNNNYSKYIPLK